MLQSELGPSDLAIFLLLSILSNLPSVWPVFGYIFSTRDLRTYNFQWRHIYVKCPITSGSNILDPQNPIFSFRHNFTKKYFFSKIRLIPDSARSDLSKEPIKSGYLCKNAKKIRFSVTTGPIRQVHYMCSKFPGIFI